MDAATEHLAVKLAFMTFERVRPKYAGIAHVDLDSVLGAALYGAARALAQFNESRGCQFRSYAISLIRFEILEEVRAQDHLPRSGRNEARRIEAETGQRPYWAEYPCSIDDPGWLGHENPEWDGEPLLRSDQLAAEDDTEAQALEQIEREQLWHAVGWLPENEEHVVDRYYRHDESHRHVAEGMDRSESRIHQLHAQGIERLRGFLGAKRGG